MSRGGRRFLILGEVVAAFALMGIGVIVRHAFRSPIAWDVVASKVGLFLVAVLLIVPLTSWLGRALKRPVWHITAVGIAVAAGVPMASIFMPLGANPALGFLAGLCATVVLMVPIHWAIRAEFSKP